MTGSKSDMHNYKKLLTMDGKLLPTLAIQMLKNQEERDAVRDKDHLHPSEICKRDWCPRASWYSLKKYPKPADSYSFQRLNVFLEGHSIHAKWQKLMWQAGVLEGSWGCKTCDHTWWDISPKTCASCSSTHIEYKEVSVVNHEHMIIGHADGIFTNKKQRSLIEIKSVGMGTIRFEAPDLFREYSSENLSPDKVWSKIRQPFASHIRQGMLYMYCTGIESLIFIYEWKPSQEVKEFSISYMPELVQPILDNCSNVVAALKGDIPVHRPAWAEEPSCFSCKNCPYNSVCWKE